MRLTTVLLLAVVLLGCAGQAPPADGGELVYSGELAYLYWEDGDELAVWPVEDEAVLVFPVGRIIYSYDLDGGNRREMAYIDSTGQMMPVCPCED